MSAPVDFSITKQRLLWIVICSALVLILLFAAGVTAGFLVSGREPDGRPLHRLESSRSRTTETKPANKVPSQAAESQPGAAAASSQGLTIEAASFPTAHEASRLAALLERDGYRPVSTNENAANTPPNYYVLLGPYGTWEQASRIATELNRSYDLRTVIRPARPGLPHST